MNDVIVHMWPHVAAAAGHMIRELADPLLQQNKPKCVSAHLHMHDCCILSQQVMQYMCAV